MDPLIARLKPLDGGRMLDVATGMGGFLKLLAESFGSYTEAVGIDFSRRITEAAKADENARFTLREMDAEKIDYPDGYFDTVAIRHSLHHMANLDSALSEMRRVLKPGGLLIIGEVYQNPATERPDSQRHLHHFWADVDQLIGNPHNHTFTREEILKIVSDAGWDVSDSFDYLEELTAEDTREGLEMMLKHTGGLVEKLAAEGNRPDLVEHGRELIDRFSAGTLTNEATLYILARK